MSERRFGRSRGRRQESPAQTGEGTGTENVTFIEPPKTIYRDMTGKQGPAQKGSPRRRLDWRTGIGMCNYKGLPQHQFSGQNKTDYLEHNLGS